MIDAIGILEDEIADARDAIAGHQEHIDALIRDGLVGNVPRWEQNIAEMENYIRGIERAVAVLRDAGE